MIKTFYISYNDLDILMKDELLEAGEQWVEEQLKQEALEAIKNNTDIRLFFESVKNNPSWKDITRELYDIETDQDLEYFITEKAEDVITSAFRKVPFELELKFK